MSASEKRQPATIAVHGADFGDILPAKASVPPIYFATTYTFEHSADLDAIFEDPNSGFAYGRFGNPTVRSLEQLMNSLEGSDATVAYPTGMAAVNAVFAQFAKPGSHVIVSRDVYGATLSLIRQQYGEIGVTSHILDVTDLDEVRRVTEEFKPTLIHAETISNPLMKVTDIRGLAEIAHANGAVLSMDNTFGTPMLCRPLDIGADVVVHSTTKYLGGHGDVIGGVVSGPSDLIEPMRDRARINGTTPGPMDAFLTIRGIHTLHLRMKAHSENAREVSAWLLQDDRVGAVNYPGIDPDYLADQFIGSDRGGMLSFEIKNGDLAASYRYLESLKLIKPATTLGDAGSVTLVPAASSQRGFSPEERAAWGIGDNLIRLSVGIEDAADIIADIDQALTIACG